MSDEDLERMSYAQLWLEELGGTVPQHHGGEPEPRRRRGNEVTAARPAPDPRSDRPPA